MSNKDYTWVRMKGDDGRSLYTWFKFSRYADGTAPDGTVEISDSAHDKLYMGIAENQTVKTPSDNPSDYRWIKVGSDSVVVDKFTWFRFADDDKGTNISGDAANKAYIGVSENRLTRTPSDNPNDYRWIKVGGDVNISGTTLYTWIKYSQYHDGRVMTDAPDADTRFMGIATNKIDSTPSTQPIDYQWMRIRDGKGTPVSTDLTAVDRKTHVHYAYSRFPGGYDSVSGSPSFESDIDNANYIGIVVNYPDPSPPTDPALYVWMGKPVAGRAGPPGIQGERGKVGPAGPPKYTWIKWSQYPNGKGTTGVSVMSDDPKDRPYIGIANNKDTDQASDDADDYLWVRFTGKDGKAGTSPRPLYHHVMFSDYEKGIDLHGNNSITDNPDGKAYLGFSMNKTYRTASSDPKDYRWVKILGNTGPRGPIGDRGPQGLRGGIGLRGLQGPTGVAGKNGVDGKDGTAVNIKGCVASSSHLTYITANLKIGDGYITKDTGNLWVLTRANPSDLNSWSDAGNIRGPKGEPTYTHTKFSEFENGRDNSGNSSFTTINSKIYYMGILDNSDNPVAPEDASLYKWIRLYGHSANFTHIVFSEHKGGVNPLTKQSDFTSDYPDRAKYIGILTNSPDPLKPTDPTKYTWAYFRGERGATPSHVDPLYTWVKWSNFPEGVDESQNQSDMHDTPEDRAYMGIAINQTQRTPSTSPQDYEWMRVRGDIGASNFTHIKYSKYRDGFDPTTNLPALSDEVNLEFMGICNNSYDPTPSNDPHSYKWIRHGTGFTWIAYGDYGVDSAIPLSLKENNHTHIFITYGKASPEPGLNREEYSYCIPIASGIKLLKSDFFFRLENNLDVTSDIKTSGVIFLDKNAKVNESKPVFINDKLVIHGYTKRIKPVIDKSNLISKNAVEIKNTVDEVRLRELLKPENLLNVTSADELLCLINPVPENKYIFCEDHEIGENCHFTHLTDLHKRQGSFLNVKVKHDLNGVPVDKYIIRYNLKYHYYPKTRNHCENIKAIFKAVQEVRKNKKTIDSIPVYDPAKDVKINHSHYSGGLVSLVNFNTATGIAYDFDNAVHSFDGYFRHGSNVLWGDDTTYKEKIYYKKGIKVGLKHANLTRDMDNVKAYRYDPENDGPNDRGLFNAYAYPFNLPKKRLNFFFKDKDHKPDGTFKKYPMGYAPYSHNSFSYPFNKINEKMIHNEYKGDSVVTKFHKDEFADNINGDNAFKSYEGDYKIACTVGSAEKIFSKSYAGLVSTDDLDIYGNIATHDNHEPTGLNSDISFTVLRQNPNYQSASQPISFPAIVRLASQNYVDRHPNNPDDPDLLPRLLREAYKDNLYRTGMTTPLFYNALFNKYTRPVVDSSHKGLDRSVRSTAVVGENNVDSNIPQYVYGEFIHISTRDQASEIELELEEVAIGGFIDTSLKYGEELQPTYALLDDVVISPKKSFELSFNIQLSDGSYPIISAVEESEVLTDTHIPKSKHGYFKVYKTFAGKKIRSFIVAEICVNPDKYESEPDNFKSVPHGEMCRIGFELEHDTVRYSDETYHLVIRYDSTTKKLSGILNGKSNIEFSSNFTAEKNYAPVATVTDKKYKLLLGTTSKICDLYLDFLLEDGERPPKDSKYTNTEGKFSINRLKYTVLED